MTLNLGTSQDHYKLDLIWQESLSGPKEGRLWDDHHRTVIHYTGPQHKSKTLENKRLPLICHGGGLV